MLGPAAGVAALVGVIAAQEGVRDDSHVENVVHKAVADEFDSKILTNKTTAFLSCASGEMHVKLNFSEPFRGITYVDYDKTSPCKFYGDGQKYYELRIPLKGCGTKQEAPRVFINNIIVRFHRSLELEEDEIKTIICRYPPPLAPPPANVIAPIVEAPLLVPPLRPPKLSEIELLLIICALLFLTLLLLGIGIAYYCLKRRNVKVIKKRPISAPASEITKISDFAPITIPRAVAQSSSSESTLISDYPSESPSSASDLEEAVDRRLVDAKIPIPPAPYPTDGERAESLASVELPLRAAPIPRPKSRPYPADAERAESISSEQRVATIPRRPKRELQTADDFFIDTIKETTEDLDVDHLQRNTVIDAVEAQPLYGSIPDNDNYSQSEIESVILPQKERVPQRSSQFIDDLHVTNEHIIDTDENITNNKRNTIVQARKPKIEVKNIEDVIITTEHDIITNEEVTKRRRDTIEQFKKAEPEQLKIPTEYIAPTWDVNFKSTPVASTDQGPSATWETEDLTTRNVTDRFDSDVRQTNIDMSSTDVRDTTNVSRSFTDIRNVDITNTDVRNVDIRNVDYRTTDVRNIDVRNIDVTNVDIRSTTDIRRNVDYSVDTVLLQPPKSVTPPKPSLVSISSTPPKYELLERIVSPPPVEGIELITPPIKERWTVLISTDDTFRTLIHEAHTVEEYTRISYHANYVQVFERPVWDVIIRVLTFPDYHFEPTITIRRLPPLRDVPDVDFRSLTETEIGPSRRKADSVFSDESRPEGDRATSEYTEPPQRRRAASIASYQKPVLRPIEIDADLSDDARSDETFDIPAEALASRTTTTDVENVSGGRMVTQRTTIQSSRTMRY
ncbi:uncharacterized protein LOC100900984 [Galendromus occidentalis]|uniref:Uncharacterized protein LOC100900984 n=1 Tax=Galendromus occidentalis TaxID=34638 RepID=A0AAJ6QSJ9_9ACAR|nr:uncharacterized protein LOC100900984 [Galendromus occidentalis]